jgi:hypothetical protein
VAGKAFLIIWHDVKLEAESDYLRWRRRSVSAFRVSTAGGAGSTGTCSRYRYLTVYEGRELSVFGSQAYLARLNNPSPWSSPIAPQMFNFIRGACEVVASVGQGVGGAMLTVRIECRPGRIPALLEAAPRIAEAIAELDGVASVHVGVARLDVSGARTRETELRGSVPERAFDAAILVDGSSRREIAAASGDILRILGRTWIALVRQDHATGRPLRFAVARKETDRLIGGVGLDGSTGDEGEEPALGYWLGQPNWGNGYGREVIAAIIDYGYGPSALKRSVPARTRVARLRKGFSCTAV